MNIILYIWNRFREWLKLRHKKKCFGEYGFRSRELLTLDYCKDLCSESEKCADISN